MINTEQQRLPRGYTGIAKLLLDGDIVASGRLEDAGSWEGGRRTSFVAQAIFDNIEGIKDKFQHAKTIEVIGDKRVFKPIKLEQLKLNEVMPELERCLQ
jgi:hypothetical protein